MLTILYFARLRDQLGVADEQLALPEQVRTVKQLRDHLCLRGNIWQQTLTGRGIFIAVNQEVANDDLPLKGDEEIAFFPPVSGG